jgi:hypothetical protein
MKPQPQGPSRILPTIEAEERAGILEFEANLPRHEAERLAMDEYKRQQERKKQWS